MFVNHKIIFDDRNKLITHGKLVWNNLKFPCYRVIYFDKGIRSIFIALSSDQIVDKNGQLNIMASGKKSTGCLGLDIKGRYSKIRVVSKYKCGIKNLKGTDVISLAHDINTQFLMIIVV